VQPARFSRIAVRGAVERPNGARFLELGSTMPEPQEPPTAEEQHGRRIVLITGSTGGLGRDVALRLGERGAHVIVHGRSRERGMQVVEEIGRGPGSAGFYQADFTSLAGVRKLAEAVLRDHDRLDVLINNAGTGLSGDDERWLSRDGHELSFAVNYLSGFLLTHMLLPILRESLAPRIINVASGAQAPIDFDDVMLERGYTRSRGYGQSKLAQVMFTFDLSRKLGEDFEVNAIHPATLMDTTMVRSAGVRPRSRVEEGTDAVLNLVLRPDLGTGQYFDGLRSTRAHEQAYDEEARAKLRALSEDLVQRVVW
jgi:NAD(P)-dependent dehydrogenase (short-subunit alcohol dehydrogenase family)